MNLKHFEIDHECIHLFRSLTFLRAEELRPDDMRLMCCLRDLAPVRRKFFAQGVDKDVEQKYLDLTTTEE